MRRLMLGLAIAISTLVPNLANGDDQAIARFVMSKLQVEQQRGALKGFHVDMRVDQGTVWYKGFVSSDEQKNLILRTAQRAKHLGVVQIVDDISIRDAAEAQSATVANSEVQPTVESEPVSEPKVEQIAEQLPEMPVQQIAVQQMATAEVMEPTMAQEFVPMQAGMTAAQQATYTQDDVAVPPQPRMNIPSPSTPYGTPTAAAYGMPAPMNYPQVPASQVSGQPMPMAISGAAPQPVNGDTASMPAYAWPSYAPHPNYGAVTYPQQYSPTAWPYIGPFYPYPQVPLGWRKVTLEWDDGWWWLDFHNR